MATQERQKALEKQAKQACRDTSCRSGGEDMATQEHQKPLEKLAKQDHVHQPQHQDGLQTNDDDLWTDGEMDEDEKDTEEANRKEGDVAIKKKKRILKSQ